MRLSENMRVLKNGNEPKLVEFDQWLEKLGDGDIQTTNEQDSYIAMPEELCVKIEENKEKLSRDSAIDFTFCNLNHQATCSNWTDFVSSRAILATTNEFVDLLNTECLEKLEGEESILASADETVNPDDGTHYPVEYINTLKTAGMPPHRLILKNKAVVILLRNLNINGGLCNGTRLIIEDVINDRLIKATIANGAHKGRKVLIPKIMMYPTESKAFGFEWSRLQFPVRLGFAMTIHKSQGQSLKKVAVWLQESCFGHGQLYVAASRVGNPDDIKFYIKTIEGQPDFATRNIVYKELLQ